MSERADNRLLHDLAYSLQSNRKALEDRQHPGHDAQFHRIDEHVQASQRMGQPVVSVDTNKRELVGQFHNGGRERPPRADQKAFRYTTFSIRMSATRFGMGSVT